ncbi:MAG: hypothetical protein NVSMB44_13620 [Ktedonobacteraceae bacterium]
MDQLLQTRTRLDGIRVGVIILTLTTAIAHLYLGFKPDEELHTWFLLNGIGYLALLVAYFLPQFAQVHNLVRWVLPGYALLTITMWIILGGLSHGVPDPLDIFVKTAEVLLVIVLFIAGRRQTNQFAQ